MCGIAGIVNARPDGPSIAGALVVAMAATLAHRGPDDAGVWESEDGVVALSHRRLSIIDLSPLGRNPMSWDDGRLWITYNGEIYNFLELRQELEGLGCRFRTRTDTEVVLAAYDCWGVNAVRRFVGMFAFGLWDRTRRRLWLVRDRVGKKPVYYADSQGRFRFASELKAILADPTFARAVDPAAIRMYLRYGYVPSPSTAFAGARKLPPGHYLLYENERATITRYWDPVALAGARADRPEQALEEELESRLAVAVRQRLIADVPLGAFLSGGIDSSLVVALMREQSRSRVRTVAIRFTNAAFNEADHAAAVARHLGTDHVEETCDDRQMMAVVDQLTDMYDEPFADSSAVPTFLVSKIARNHVTVALSGDGGDELFFGYPRYRYHASASWLLNLPGPVRRAVAFGAERMPTRRLRRVAEVLRSDEQDCYARFVTWWTSDQIVELTGEPPADAPLYAEAAMRTASMSREQRPCLLDLVSYLPEDILTKVDRASMAVGLEVRAPLLDHRVVEFALGLPQSVKYRDRSTKWILRQLLYKRVPRALVDRPKMGFGVPLGEWFKGPLRERMDDDCTAADLEKVGVDPEPVRALWRDFQAGRSHRSDLLWQMLMLAAWSRRLRTAPLALASVAPAVTGARPGR